MVKPEVLDGWLWLNRLLQDTYVTVTDQTRRAELKNLLDILSAIPEPEKYA